MARPVSVCRPARVGAIGLVALLVVTACRADDSAVVSPQAAFPEQTVRLDDLGAVVAESVSRSEVDVVLAAGLDVDVVDALAGYLSGRGRTVEGGGWELDLSGLARPAERAALALLDIGVVFERHGDGGDILIGFEPLTDVEARVASARSAAGRQPNDVVAAVAEREVTDLTESGRIEQVAAVPAVDPIVLVGSPEHWLPATTGSPVPGAPLDPPSNEGGVSWNNREAQAYRPEMVGFAAGSSSDGLTLTARTRTGADTQRLPFESGMVLSRETFTWGTWAFQAAVPSEAGLWPAVWLLGTDACDNPGRCPGYESTDYLELDLFEVATREPAVLHTSVHWFDERVRSQTAETQVEAPGDPLVVEMVFERRPGLLRWWIDGDAVFTVAGPAESDRGPHRPGPVRLVVNLAVGGSFAGDRILGPTSAWWGDARVPAGFPDHGWDDATFSIGPVTFTPLVEP